MHGPRMVFNSSKCVKVAACDIRTGDIKHTWPTIVEAAEELPDLITSHIWNEMEEAVMQVVFGFEGSQHPRSSVSSFHQDTGAEQLCDHAVDQ